MPDERENLTDDLEKRIDEHIEKVLSGDYQMNEAVRVALETFDKVNAQRKQEKADS